MPPRTLGLGVGDELVRLTRQEVWRISRLLAQRWEARQHRGERYRHRVRQGRDGTASLGDWSPEVPGRPCAVSFLCSQRWTGAIRGEVMFHPFRPGIGRSRRESPDAASAVPRGSTPRLRRTHRSVPAAIAAVALFCLMASCSTSSTSTETSPPATTAAPTTAAETAASPAACADVAALRSSIDALTNVRPTQDGVSALTTAIANVKTDLDKAQASASASASSLQPSVEQVKTAFAGLQTGSQRIDRREPCPEGASHRCGDHAARRREGGTLRGAGRTLPGELTESPRRGLGHRTVPNHAPWPPREGLSTTWRSLNFPSCAHRNSPPGGGVQSSGWRVPVVVRRSWSLRAWWSRRR